ncbi:hypothetical protein HRI_000090700 [Hibiscus trionum]|uniref:Uncharacterized protein n=1 Tax=Hibiscus trionum TaxID=183268 RepID=A0A9W7GSR8_HIBTR|nr:hypothetical protein HRI_000090700 [Hibiscus trionum]
MASMEPRFQVTVDYSLNSIEGPIFSKIQFVLRIRTFLEDDNGCFRPEDFRQFSVWPEAVFGSQRHRNIGNGDGVSVREDPELVPATKESIQALKKVKLAEGYDGGGEEEDGIECMICMENHTCPLCRFPVLTGTDAGKL